MGFQGDLDSVGLANIFQALTANQQSGTLHVYDATSEKYLIFAQGFIRSVSSGKRQAAPLGEILVARGVLTPEALATALAEQRATRRPLGLILVESGLCRQEEIDAALRFQMEDEIYDLFTWRGAKFEFDEKRSGDTLVGSEMRISQVAMNTGGILLEAMRRLDDWERFRALIPTLDIIPTLAADRSGEDLAASLSAEERRILGFIDGANSIQDIARKSCLGRYAVVKLLADLFARGAAREATAEEMRRTAEALVLQGEPLAALSLYRRLVALEPSDYTARRALATILESAGNAAEAAAEFMALAERLAAEGNFAAAAEAAGRAHGLQGERLDICERYAGFCARAGSLKEARETWLAIIRRCEERKDKAAALAKSEAALADLPEDEELLRARARLLIETGRGKEAASVYETLALFAEERGDAAGAINLWRSVQRLDAGRTQDAERRILALRLTESQQLRRRVWLRLGVTSGALILAAALAFFFLEARNSLRVRQALREAAAKEAQAVKAEAAERLRLLEEAESIIEQARPTFSLFYGQTFFAAQPEAARIRRLRQETAKELSALGQRQAEIIARWRQRGEEGTAAAEAAWEDLRLLAQEKIETEAVREARRLLQEWESRRTQARGEIAELLQRIGDRALAAAERFAAYRRLAEQYPETLRQRSPHGPADLTLPTRIEAVTNTGQPLRAEISIGGAVWPETTPCTVELPCDPAVTVTVACRGFAGVNGQPATLKRDGRALRDAYTIELYRRPLFHIACKGAFEGVPALSSDGKIAYLATAAGEIAAVNIANGKILWRWPPEKSRAAATAFRQSPVLSETALFAADSGGVVVCCAPADGRLLWQTSPLVNPLLPSAPASLLLMRAKAGPALLISAQGAPPLAALAVADGALRWPRSDAVRKALGEKIGAAISGKPYHLAKEGFILAISADG
ncbi:MAG: DUF4388 domain-containing protein, partial [Planctomycetota bacterium]|nr:DUF4388 domain-containing protein [Planctomycetota bacterium]